MDGKIHQESSPDPDFQGVNLVLSLQEQDIPKVTNPNFSDRLDA